MLATPRPLAGPSAKASLPPVESDDACAGAGRRRLIDGVALYDRVDYLSISNPQRPFHRIGPVLTGFTEDNQVVAVRADGNCAFEAFAVGVTARRNPSACEALLKPSIPSPAATRHHEGQSKAEKRWLHNG